MEYSLPGSSAHGISQARILEWVVISSSRRSFRPKDRTCFSCMAGGFFTAEPLGKPSIRQHTQNIANYAHSPLPMLTVFYLWCSEFLLELDHLLPMWLTLSQPFPLLSRGKTFTATVWFVAWSNGARRNITTYRCLLQNVVGAC